MPSLKDPFGLNDVDRRTHPTPKIVAPPQTSSRTIYTPAARRQRVRQAAQAAQAARLRSGYGRRIR